MDKLLIVDGHNLLFQMFYGMPSRIVGKNGKPVHGVLGFVGALIKIIKMTNPSHVVVLFDGEHSNFRAQLNPEYKANRLNYSDVVEEENPFSQLDYIYRALKILNIPYFEENEYEVDDIIATYVYRYRNCAKIIISSFDSDYFQLIGDNVSVLRYRGKQTTICDSASILNKFGIAPALYADFKSLTGDSADNIKGLKGVGAKTAGHLLNTFGNIDNIISNVEQIKSESLRNTIMESGTLLRNNFELIKLKDIGKIPYNLSELSYAYGGETTRGILEKLELL